MQCTFHPLAAATDLEDEEAVVVQVNALGLEQVRHLLEVALLVVHVVVRRVAARRIARDDQLAAWHHFKLALALHGSSGLVDVC